ncbi:PucR family transcriptional regulator [Nocardia heshunensis]
MLLGSVLTMTDLGLELVTGDSALDREVRWLVTTNLLEPGRYLSGGELVLTGLHWRQHPADSDVFVRALAAAGATALLAGQARYDGIPDDVVAACDRHGIPLLRVPRALRFEIITERVNRELSTGRAGDLSAVLDRHRSHLAGNGLAPLLELVEQHLGIRCWILTATGRVVAGAALAPPEAATAAFLTAATLPTVLRDNGIAYSILAADEDGTPRILDRLLVLEGDYAEWPDEHRTLARELAALVAQLRTPTPAQGSADQRLIDLVASDPAPALLNSQLQPVGLGSEGKYASVALTGLRNRYRHELAGLLREILTGATPVVGLIAETAVALLRADNKTLAALPRTVAALAAGLDGDRLCVGISGAVAVEGLPGAIEEARYACRIAAEHTEPSRVVGRDELASRTALLASVPGNTRRDFRRELLEPLLAYDREHRADLLTTLETFLDVSGSWAKCAATMYLHVNTVRYRIQRIEELTGRDLSRFEDRVDFYLALALR